MPELWLPGNELPRMVRTMSAERMRWYADALHTVEAGSTEPLVAPPNIHTDDDIARANGLPARVADGMVSTNWISTLLAETFGERYLEGGSLRTRYVRPIFVDEQIEVVVRITEGQTTSDRNSRLVAQVSCVKSDGVIATAGTATVRAPDAVDAG
jgi:MaoC like domain